MPLEAADRLAKSFDRHLSLVAENDNNLRWRLRKLGWKDFVDQDFPETDSPIEMAIAALQQIGLETDGSWCGVPELIVAIFAFLSSHGVTGPQRDVRELGDCLSRVPVAPDEIRSWFHEALLKQSDSR